MKIGFDHRGDHGQIFFLGYFKKTKIFKKKFFLSVLYIGVISGAEHAGDLIFQDFFMKKSSF